MDDNKVKWTRKVRRYLRDAFSWLDTGLMLNALLIMDIHVCGLLRNDAVEIQQGDRGTGGHALYDFILYGHGHRG